jgi:uncharacterized repeat protein (TIGR01451 family)
VKSHWYALLLVAGWPLAAAAMPPCDCSAPLLYVRFLAPPGVRITFYPGHTPVRSFPTPVTVGLRPGYVYRVKLSNFKDEPKLALYPSIEVRNTLSLPKVVRALDHPAPALISFEDVRDVLRGSMMTKVLVLEDPEQAIAEPSTPDQPIEVDAPASETLVRARLHGRPLAIVRMGEREMSEPELAACGIPGTISFPGDRILPPPAGPPHFAFGCLSLLDPFYGAKCPEGECLHDGGDGGAPAGIDRNGQLHGVDPSDTVAAYKDAYGQRHIAISNRVCICVPRFVIIRSELLPAGYESRVRLHAADIVQSQLNVRSRQPSEAAMQSEQLVGFRGRSRPGASITVEGPRRMNIVEFLGAYHLNIGTGESLGTEAMRKLTTEQRAELRQQMEFAKSIAESAHAAGVEQGLPGPQAVGRVEGVNVVSQLQEIRDFTSSCCEKPEIPPRPLYLYKWASARAGKVGDIVTFFLKYSNLGGKPITDVAVSDSLTGRLEYIPGTAKSGRDAVFTTEENKAGSVILHWEVSGVLPPGESGVVSFQARIR